MDHETFQITALAIIFIFVNSLLLFSIRYFWKEIKELKKQSAQREREREERQRRKEQLYADL